MAAHPAFADLPAFSARPTAAIIGSERKAYEHRDLTEFSEESTQHVRR